MKVTIKQIAEKAGVSPGSVSNALNNRKGSISPATREHIIQVAQELGYFKKGKRVGIITLVLYDAGEKIVQSEQPFFSSLIKGIELGCKENEYQLKIKTVHREDKHAIEALDDVSETDGLLIIGTEMLFKDVEKFKNFKIPFVIVDNAYIKEEFDFIAINNKDGMYEITKLLIDKGYKNIGLINSIRKINNFKERRIGFMQALEDNDIHFDLNNELFLEPTIEGSQEDMKAYLKQQEGFGIDLPEAYVCMNDYLAIGVLRALKQENKLIPITGFDDIEMAKYCEPALTTVHVDKEQLGKTAVRRLVEKFNGTEISLKILVNSKVIERKSTKYFK